jgi:ferrous iron transport protein B
MMEKCDTCPAHAQLAQMGLELTNVDRVVALAGNPNTGKSTVFNALTGLKQHTGNWPGKTVTRAEGGYQYASLRYKLVDLPGTYSLLSTSQDEEIARDFILFGQPDCTIVVADATTLERNLNLVLQVLEITDRVVVCVNLMDEARRKGLQVDLRSLARDLGVPCVGAVARTGEGLGDLIRTVAEVIEGTIATSPYRPAPPADVRSAIEAILPLIERVAPGLPNGRWVAYRLLDGDHRVRQALLNGELAQLVTAQASPAERANRKIALQGAQ